MKGFSSSFLLLTTWMQNQRLFQLIYKVQGIKGWQTFSIKGQRVNIFDFVGQVSVTTTQPAVNGWKLPQAIYNGHV